MSFGFYENCKQILMQGPWNIREEPKKASKGRQGISRGASQGAHVSLLT